VRRWAFLGLVVVFALLVGAGEVAQQKAKGQSGEPERAVKVATRVVPIVSLGRGVRIGAAMITGPVEYVRLVGVVAQIETKWKNFRIRALVPAAALPGDAPPDKQRMRRVPKVSVKAIIDMRI